MNLTVGASVFIVYGTFIVLYFLMNRNRSRTYRITYAHCVVCYSLCLLLLTLLPDNNKEGVNFIPFINILKEDAGGRVFELTHFLEYLFGSLLNVLLFVPLGIIVGVRCRLGYIKKPLLKALLTGAAVSVAIEFLQWLLPVHRFTDIDDVIFNIVGACAGIIVFGFLQHKAFIRRFLKMMRLSGDVDQILS